MPPELEKAIVATLIKEYHLTLDQIGELTDRQIVDYYFHPRDKETGVIKIPSNWNVDEFRTPLTLEEELMQLDSLAIQVNLTPENVEECRRQLREKFSKKDKK